LSNILKEGRQRIGGHLRKKGVVLKILSIETGEEKTNKREEVTSIGGKEGSRLRHIS